MSRLRVILLLLVMFLFTIVLSAQDTSCSALVQSALQTVNDLCDVTDRNQVCYGNIQLSAILDDDAPEINFTTPGDIVDVVYIQSLQLSALKTPEEWGIALMKLQANLPDTVPGQSATMLLFGDVYVENQAEALPDPLSGIITASANLRSGPSTDYRIVGAGQIDDEVIVDARNEAGDWFRIFRADTGDLAWIFGTLIEIEGDELSLTVVEVDDPVATGQFGPMQAFFFRNGVGNLSCQEAPPDGILIQTPSGVGTVAFSANNVRLQLGSTAFLTAIPDDFMTITLLEGQGSVTADGSTLTIPTGLRARIPLNSDGLPIGPPELVTYDAEEVDALPVDILDEPFDIPPPAEIPTPIPDPFARYAGTWNIGVTSPVNCSNGSRFLGAGGGFSATVNSSGTGLTWGSWPLAHSNGSTFSYAQQIDTGGILTHTFNFISDSSGTYSITLNANGAPSFGCNEIVTASAPMSR